MAAWEEAPLVGAPPEAAARPAWEAAPLVDAPVLESRDADGGLVLEMSNGPRPGATPAQRIQSSIPGRVLQGMRDPVDAVTQMGMRAIPNGVINGVNSATRFVNGLPVIGPVTKALGMVPATQAGLDQQIRDNEAQYQASRAATGSGGIDFARLGGNILATLPAVGASLPATGASMLARVGTGIASGAAFGGLQPVTEGNFGAEKLKQMGVGGGTGAGGAMLGGALARLVSPNASTNPQVQTLLNAGITPTPGQMLGGIAQRTEDKLTSVPILGDAIVAARRRGIDEFNTAALNRAGAPVGTQVTATGREGMQQVQTAIGNAYDNIVPRLTFRADNVFNQELQQIRQMGQILPPPQAHQLNTILRDKVLGKLTPQGAATGQNYREIEQELGRLASQYRSAADVDQRQLGAALGELQNSLRANLTRSNPAEAAELGRINEAYSNLVRLQRAAGGAGADTGVFTPAQLAASVRQSDSTVRKNAYARGDALMQDLSDAGKSVMSSRIPDSGTAGRAMAAGLGGAGAGLFAPNLLLGVGAATIPYLPYTNRLTAMALGMRPQAAQGIANQIRRVGPALGILAGPAAYQGSGN